MLCYKSKNLCRGNLIMSSSESKHFENDVCLASVVVEWTGGRILMKHLAREIFLGYISRLFYNFNIKNLWILVI